MQGRTSSIPEVYAFSVQALAACEALIHPRCNQPWPSPAASQQPARNGRATDAVEVPWRPTHVGLFSIGDRYLACALPLGKASQGVLPAHACEGPGLQIHVDTT